LIRGHENAMRTKLAACALALSLALTSCHGAGPYGHASRYAELDEETRAAAGARDYDPVMVQREPEEWRKGTVTLFGVVENRTPGPGGKALLRLSVRRLASRNLCESAQDEDSCRVTVSDKDFGVVWALVSLRAEDDVGPNAAQQRSLFRVVGTIAQEVSPDNGAPVIHASYYRHWPPLFYVTGASAVNMRQ
jgi:hypothetical protein